MVHGEHRVALRQYFGIEGGVGGQRSQQFHALAAQFLQRGYDRVDFLAPQVPALPGVGVEPQYRDTGSAQAELVAQVPLQDMQGFPQ